MASLHTALIRTGILRWTCILFVFVTGVAPQQQLTTPRTETKTYQYEYDILSQYHNESKGPNGVVKGEYGHWSPDGWFRITNYTADKDGYRVNRRRLRARKGQFGISGQPGSPISNNKPPQSSGVYKPAGSGGTLSVPGGYTPRTQYSPSPYGAGVGANGVAGVGVGVGVNGVGGVPAGSGGTLGVQGGYTPRAPYSPSPFGVGVGVNGVGGVHGLGDRPDGKQTYGGGVFPGSGPAETTLSESGLNTAESHNVEVKDGVPPLGIYPNQGGYLETSVDPKSLAAGLDHETASPDSTKYQINAQTPKSSIIRPIKPVYPGLLQTIPPSQGVEYSPSQPGLQGEYSGVNEDAGVGGANKPYGSGPLDTGGASGPYGIGVTSGPYGTVAESGRYGTGVTSGPYGFGVGSGPHGTGVTSGPHGIGVTSGPHGISVTNGPYGPVAGSGPYGIGVTSGPYDTVVGSGPYGTGITSGPHGKGVTSGLLGDGYSGISGYSGRDGRVTPKTSGSSDPKVSSGQGAGGSFGVVTPKTQSGPYRPAVQAEVSTGGVSKPHGGVSQGAVSSSGRSQSSGHIRGPPSEPGGASWPYGRTTKTYPDNGHKPGFTPGQYEFSDGQSSDQSCKSQPGHYTVPAGFPDNLKPLGVARDDHSTADGQMVGKYTLTFPLGYVMEISYSAYQDPVLAAKYLPQQTHNPNC